MQDGAIISQGGFLQFPGHFPARRREALSLWAEHEVQIPAVVVRRWVEGALHLVDVELDPLGVICDTVAVADDEIIVGEEALQEAVFATGVHHLGALVGLGFCPHAALEVVQGEGRETGFIETSGVAHDVQLVQVTEQRKTDLGVLIDALSQKDIALWAPARVGFLNLLGRAALVVELCNDRCEVGGEEDACAPEGLGAVSLNVVHIL